MFDLNTLRASNGGYMWQSFKQRMQELMEQSDSISRQLHDDFEYIDSRQDQNKKYKDQLLSLAQEKKGIEAYWAAHKRIRAPKVAPVSDDDDLSTVYDPNNKTEKIEA